MRTRTVLFALFSCTIKFCQNSFVEDFLNWIGKIITIFWLVLLHTINCNDLTNFNFLCHFSNDFFLNSTDLAMNKENQPFESKISLISKFFIEFTIDGSIYKLSVWRPVSKTKSIRTNENHEDKYCELKVVCWWRWNCIFLPCVFIAYSHRMT